MDLILKSLKSKTVQFSIALAALSILQGYIGFLPVGQAAQAAIGVGIAVCAVVHTAEVITAYEASQEENSLGA